MNTEDLTAEIEVPEINGIKRGVLEMNSLASASRGEVLSLPVRLLDIISSGQLL